VLRPGGGMVLYAVMATGRLAPGDRQLLVEGLGNSPASMHRPTVEAAIAAGTGTAWRLRWARCGTGAPGLDPLLYALAKPA
jgi:hypothetical protein